MDFYRNPSVLLTLVMYCIWAENFSHYLYLELYMFRLVMPIGAINELSVSRPHYEANREI